MIVYPPALFDSPEEEGVAMKKNETCEVENEYVEDIEPGDKDCSVPGGCSNFEKFMSLAKQQSDMAQYLNAARGQDIESETLSVSLLLPLLASLLMLHADCICALGASRTMCCPTLQTTAASHNLSLQRLLNTRRQPFPRN